MTYLRYPTVEEQRELDKAEKLLGEFIKRQGGRN